jgi:hypothetical protein
MERETVKVAVAALNQVELAAQDLLGLLLVVIIIVALLLTGGSGGG